MNVIFRADASFMIGTGHVMRCLTLADALIDHGIVSHFICRAHPGNMIETIRLRGHTAHLLPMHSSHKSDLTPPHAGWLGCSWEQDVEETLKLVEKIRPSWVIVDHYALEARWEMRVRLGGARVLVIDDLTDRPHECDLLLNQNLGASAEAYRSLVPGKTRCLMGPRFALLRPKFRANRELLASADMRDCKNHWLACVGGTDPHQILPKILAAWRALPDSKPSLGIAVRENSPNIQTLIESAAGLPGVSLYINNEDMADLLMEADLLIGSAGSMSWERCCLGVPSVMGMVAENQRSLLKLLARARTGISVGEWQKLSVEGLILMLSKLQVKPRLLQRMGVRAGKLVDGGGSERVALALTDKD